MRVDSRSVEIGLRQEALRYVLAVLIRHVSQGTVEVVEFSQDFQDVRECIVPVYEYRGNKEVSFNSEDTFGPKEKFVRFDFKEPEKILDVCRRNRRVAELVIKRCGVNIAYGHMPPKPLRSWLGSHLAGYIQLPKHEQKKRSAQEKDTLICGLMDKVNDISGIQFGCGKFTSRPKGSWQDVATCSDLIWSGLSALGARSGSPTTIHKIHSDNSEKRRLAGLFPEVFEPALLDRFVQDQRFPVGGYYPSLSELAERKLRSLYPHSD